MPSTNAIPDLDHLRTYYLAFGPALKIAVLNRQIGLPTRTLSHWLKGEQALAPWHVPKVHAWAVQAGYDPSRQYDQFL